MKLQPMQEKTIERSLVETVQARGGLCLKWVCPGWAGVPDRICLLPGGLIIFAELKRPGGVIAARQEWWRDKLAALGFRHYYVCGKSDIAAIIKYIDQFDKG